MPEPITISFVGTVEIKTLLELWAKEDDRSVSYIIRRILEKEVQRRRSAQVPKRKTQATNKRGMRQADLLTRPNLTQQ